MKTSTSRTSPRSRSRRSTTLTRSVTFSSRSARLTRSTTHRACRTTVRKWASPHPHLHLGMSADVLQPVRGLVFGNHVKAAVAMGEPDFNFSGLARFASARGEVDILLGILSRLRPRLLLRLPTRQLLPFQLQLGLIFFKEFAQFVGGVEQ